MFPDTHDGPASLLKKAVDLGVTTPVPGYLPLPVLDIGFRRNAVHRASMPETAVNKDGNTGGDKGEIGSARQSTIEPVAQAGAPERMAESDFDGRIRAADSGHASASLLGSHIVGRSLH